MSSNAGPAQLRLVLVGRTGAGKSATGNTIFGEERFQSQLSMSSVTNTCKLESGVVARRKLVLIDTPGWFDTSMAQKQVEEEVIRCLSMCSPGPHAFLLIIPITRFTDEQQKTVEMIQTVFQEDMTKHCIIIFTHADQLRKEGKSFEQFISEQDQKIQALVQRFGNRFLAFNNDDPENRAQVMELLDKLDDLLEQNKHQHFTNQRMQIVGRAMEVLEKYKDALMAAFIRKEKQDVRQTGEQRKDMITKELEKDMEEISRRRQHIKDKLSQTEADERKENERPCGNPGRLRRLQESLQREADNLKQLDEEEDRRRKEAEVEWKEVDVWIQEEEQRVGVAGKDSTDDKSRFYIKPFYFNILMCLVMFMGRAAGFIPMLWSFMVPAAPAAPTGIMAQLAALVGPELTTILTAAVGRAAQVSFTQCTIQ